jgi:maltose alpha-D-glucosyltransferase/alpha-amylase
LDNNSLLNWTERAIRNRKECPEFGWGERSFLETNHPAVLAHACTWRGNTLVAIHNLSRAACTVTISWPSGTEKLEAVFGRENQQPLQGVPSSIDLEGYDYRWLRLRVCQSAT